MLSYDANYFHELENNNFISNATSDEKINSTNPQNQIITFYYHKFTIRFVDKKNNAQQI